MPPKKILLICVYAQVIESVYICRPCTCAQKLEKLESKTWCDLNQLFVNGKRARWAVIGISKGGRVSDPDPVGYGCFG